MDAFAQIAKSWTGGRQELLCRPEPAPLPDTCLSLQPADGTPTPVPPKMRTAAQLRDALEALRAQRAPFLANHAPALPSFRKLRQLRDFRWQKHPGGPWQAVTLPHYEGPLGAAVTCYETDFELEAPGPGEAAFVTLRGADYFAEVYVNDALAGTHEGFFAAFSFDITALVHPGVNRLRIVLKNDYVMKGNCTEDDPRVFCGDKIYAATGPGYDDPAFGWHHCPPAMGILEPVEVEIRPQIYLDSVFARTLDDEMEFWIEVGSTLYAERGISFRLSVYGQNRQQTVVEDLPFVPVTGKELGLGDTFSEVLSKREGTLNARLPLPCMKGRNLYKVRLPARDLAWWTPETPWLYQLQVRLLDEQGTLLDTLAQSFGRRTFTQQQDHTGRNGMFFLNGQALRLRGANTMGFEQQDVMRGDDAQLIDDILLAKLCNMNFLRITQRPVQQKIYDYCDRLGLMIQTDFPLFGCLRRQQFCEALRQTEEMERHIRAHPCCILVTYINEPFPNANNHPNVNLERSELEQFFAAADLTVRLNNPDRVIKHVDGDYDPPSASMPDNHCYPMWYNGHGIDIGLLHKGYWMPVRPGWYYGCGEYGCEGLEDWDLMQAAYPADWLLQPGESPDAWGPERIVGAQTADFYHFFYSRPHTPQQWVDESQKFQALATRMMTEAFRRDARMVSFAIHLFIDAFPSGWMKTIMDCRRTPKPAFFAYRDAAEPLLVSLRTDRTRFFGGDTARVEGWLCNDTDRTGDCVLRYELLCGDELLQAAEQSVALTAGSVACQSTVQFQLPLVEKRTGLMLRACLMQGETCLAWNELELTAFPPCGPIPELRVRRAEDLTPDDLHAAENGALLWVDKPTAGRYTLGEMTFTVQESGMAPMHYACPQTGHPWAWDLTPEDMRHWYDDEVDRIAPLADCTVQAAGFATVLGSRNIGPDGRWQPAALLCERSVGRGRVILSQISLRQMLQNPAGCILLSRIGM